MNYLRRLLTVIVVVLTMVLATNMVSAPSVVAQEQRTPAELCASAEEDIQEPESREFEQAEDVLQEGVDYGAVLCTQQGPIYLDLLEEEAPLTVNNFVFLAQQGFYNNITFHRVLPGFMAQGGDPSGTGSGGPGYSFGDETDNGLTFEQPGLLAMANSGPDTNGSQFFITYAPTTHLDGAHTIFGRVVQGIEVAELLTPRDPQYGPTFEGDLLNTVVITEDPAGVNSTPDGPPSLDHLQALLENAIATQISTVYTPVAELSHTFDAEQEAESWAEQGGDELVAFMSDFLAGKNFGGTAALVMVGECPATPEEMPIWGLGFQVADYQEADAGEAVVFDEARSEKLVETGAFESYEDPAEFGGRIYRMPDESWCNENGVAYRYEVPYGRYVLTVDLVVDQVVIGEDKAQLHGFLSNVSTSLLLSSMQSALDRGNTALAAE